MYLDGNDKYCVPKLLVCLNTNVTNAAHVVLWQFFAVTSLAENLSHLLNVRLLYMM